VLAVDRAIDILTTFTHSQPELTLGEVAERTGLSKSTAFRLLATLKLRGLIHQDPRSAGYSLGFGVLPLADIRAHQTNLRDRALPVMRHIRDLVNETVALSVRLGDYRIHLDHVESTHPFRRTAEVGLRVPLYVGAASKVFLAAMEDAKVAAYLKRTPLVPFSPTTITDPDRLWKELREIRRRGYAESRNERNIGGAGVAAAVRDYTGEVVAAIHVSVPVSRYTPNLRARCIQAILDGTALLSSELGYRPEGRGIEKTREGEARAASRPAS